MNISIESERSVRDQLSQGLTDGDPASEFLEFISEESYPCLAARGIAKRRDFSLKDYGLMDRSATVKKLAADLHRFTVELEEGSDDYRTFVASFSREPEAGEIGFEKGLWELLSRLTRFDPEGWDPAVSDDPGNPGFSFSFAGEAYYIVGLHPSAIRPARRFRYPTLIFNRHRFFDELRKSGGYGRMRELVRERDFSENGSINEMLADFGTISEARQYSGRQVDDEWKCPHAEAFRRQK